MNVRPFCILAVICFLIAGLFFAGSIEKTIYAQQRVETRCGWLLTPTPGNVWLIDKDGEWTIGIQGGYQAKGDWPEIPDSQFVKTNVNHGYGCACMRMRTERRSMKVIEIVSGKPRPLSTCRRDRALKRKEPTE